MNTSCQSVYGVDPKTNIVFRRKALPMFGCYSSSTIVKLVLNFNVSACFIPKGNKNDFPPIPFPVGSTSQTFISGLGNVKFTIKSATYTLNGCRYICPNTVCIKYTIESDSVQIFEGLKLPFVMFNQAATWGLIPGAELSTPKPIRPTPTPTPVPTRTPTPTPKPIRPTPTPTPTPIKPTLTPKPIRPTPTPMPIIIIGTTLTPKPIRPTPTPTPVPTRTPTPTPKPIRPTPTPTPTPTTTPTPTPRYSFITPTPTPFITGSGIVTPTPTPTATPTRTPTPTPFVFVPEVIG